MAYKLSPAKLQTYQTCPAQYRFRYELGLPGGFGGAAAGFGRAVHGALMQAYREWDYPPEDFSPQGLHHRPGLDWFDRCWDDHNTGLNEAQIAEGREIFARYWAEWVAPLAEFRRPLATEKTLRGRLVVENLLFFLTGKLDRLDWCGPAALELVEYKTAKHVPALSGEGLDLQLGLYALAIEQQWPGELKRATILSLRSGESLTVDITPERRDQASAMIADLALRLRTDDTWEPTPGAGCDRCGYYKYCPAQTPEPDPLPEGTGRSRPLQLALT